MERHHQLVHIDFCVQGSVIMSSEFDHKGPWESCWLSRTEELKNTAAAVPNEVGPPPALSCKAFFSSPPRQSLSPGAAGTTLVCFKWIPVFYLFVRYKGPRWPNPCLFFRFKPYFHGDKQGFTSASVACFRSADLYLSLPMQPELLLCCFRIRLAHKMGTVLFQL